MTRLKSSEAQIKLAERIAKDPAKMPDYKVRDAIRRAKGRTGEVSSIRHYLSRGRTKLKAINLGTLDLIDAGGLLYALNQMIDFLTEIKNQLEDKGIEPVRQQFVNKKRKP